jgi:hypothetical protein
MSDYFYSLEMLIRRHAWIRAQPEWTESIAEENNT